MACNYQGKIVTNGLVLCLDAADKKSYPGTGSTWLDRSGNSNHFELFNSPLYSDNYINFNGVNQYAKSYSTLNLSSFNSVTVEIILKTNTLGPNSGMAFEHSSDWNTQAMGFGLVPNSVGNTNYAANSHHTNQISGLRFDYDGIMGSDIVCHTNIWSRVADNTGRLAFINAIQRNPISSTTVTSSYANFRNDFLYISSRAGTSVFANHRVYSIRIYGRKLNVQEIQQNFNATRGRFGI